jgi:hypothetical protein
MCIYMLHAVLPTHIVDLLPHLPHGHLALALRVPRHICCMQICEYVKKTLLELGFMGFMGFSITYTYLYAWDCDLGCAAS